MQNPTNPTRSSGSSGQSLQSQLLEHFLRAFERVEDTFLIPDKDGDDSQRWETFTLQIEYVLHLLPDDVDQDAVRKIIDEKIEEFERRYSGARYARYIAHMSAITESLNFLNSGLDLIHDDIVAPLTERARQQSEEPMRQKKEDKGTGEISATQTT
jgi:hypothetical protein